MIRISIGKSVVYSQPHRQIRQTKYRLLPEGWECLQKNGIDDGGHIYENVLTQERIEWRPKKPASDKANESPDLDPDHGLPEGWFTQMSGSRPGELVYVNEFTEARFSRD